MAKVTGIWTIREKKNGLVVAEKTVKNVLTSYGLTAWASAFGGQFTPPQYIAVESNPAVLQSTLVAGISTSVILNIRVDQPGDTQLVLDPGQAGQETVTYTTITGSGPYTYGLTGHPANNHSSGATVVRMPTENDTMSSVVGEQEYDATNAPGQRMVVLGGYSAGPGNWTVQAYFPGPQSLMNFLICGLVDDPNIGSGNLYNHFVLGFNHTDPSSDVELDGSLTLTN